MLSGEIVGIEFPHFQHKHHRRDHTGQDFLQTFHADLFLQIIYPDSHRDSNFLLNLQQSWQYSLDLTLGNRPDILQLSEQSLTVLKV